MGFNSGPPSADIDQPVLTSDRRTFLTVLDGVVGAMPGLACGIVFVVGTPALRVISISQPRRSVTIGADYTDGDWWFCWPDGATIGPVDDPEGAANVIAHHLQVQP